MASEDYELAASLKSLQGTGRGQTEAQEPAALKKPAARKKAAAPVVRVRHAGRHADAGNPGNDSRAVRAATPWTSTPRTFGRHQRSPAARAGRLGQRELVHRCGGPHEERPESGSRPSPTRSSNDQRPRSALRRAARSRRCCIDEEEDGRGLGARPVRAAAGDVDHGDDPNAARARRTGRSSTGTRTTRASRATEIASCAPRVCLLLPLRASFETRVSGTGI